MKHRPIKQTEFQKCAKCDKGVMHDNNMTFFQVSITNMMINLNAVQRQHGLEMVIGNPMIANVMGTNEDMGVPIGDTETVLICFDCSLKVNIPGILESREKVEVETDAHK